MIPCLSFLNARVPEMSHPILGLRTNSGRQALTPFEDSTSKTLHCASAVSLPCCGPSFQHLIFWGTPCMYSTLCTPVQPTGYADFTTEVPQPAWRFMQHFMQTDFLTVTGVPRGIETSFNWLFAVQPRTSITLLKLVKVMHYMIL